uniref:Uncharacterized protein n=1 Tax=Arundo donax TaxID=35708 RepID=A0A0A8YJS3_ARUDO
MRCHHCSLSKHYLTGHAWNKNVEQVSRKAQ